MGARIRRVSAAAGMVATWNVLPAVAQTNEPPRASFDDQASAPADSAPPSTTTAEPARPAPPPTAPPPTSAATAPPGAPAAAPPGAPPPVAYPSPYAYPYPPPPPPYPYGYETAPPPPKPPPPTRQVTLMLSPVHLLFPVVEVTAEFRAAPWVGLAAIGGGGRITVDDSLGEAHDFTVWEVGGQANFYLMSDFQGLHVGAEVLYMNVDTADVEEDITGTANGIAFGPLVGYKLVTRAGFTFVPQAGVQYVIARAHATETTSGDTASDEDSKFIPMLNLNLGWSF